MARNATATTPVIEQLALSWLGINAVEIEQRTTSSNIVLGTSDGLADQQLQLPATSVEAETLQLQVEESGTWVTWYPIDDLATLDRDPAIAREARVFMLDSEAGTVRFGDNMRGRIPPAGARIRTLLLRAGGGAAGNVPAGTLKDIAALGVGNAPPPELKVEQPLACDGGADAETLAQAERRIPGLFRHRDRAVTEDDYRQIAFETPAVQVGRVENLPRFKPQNRFFDVPGVITVMALPARALSGPPNPRADRPFLTAVHSWLERRRPLGTELYVIGCEYRPIGLSVAVSLAEGAARDTTLQAVRDSLRRCLWPLVPGGFDGQGWPLGRALSDRELGVEVARVPGVSEVHGVNLFVRSGDDWQIVGEPMLETEKNVQLNAWELPELLSVVVVAVDGTGAPPTDLRALPNPFAATPAVAVPVVPEVC
jgi:predicted phage baseplate assembly protein